MNDHTPDIRLDDVWTEVDAQRMYARAALHNAPPNAPVAILVHGLVVSSAYMEPLARHLAPYFRVYAPDLPGFGKSDEPGRTLQLDELADSLLKWMDATEIEEAVLVGNSFGCQIVTAFAVRYPERVSRMVLLGPTTDPGARSMVRQALRWLANSLQEPPSLGPLLLRDYLSAGLIRAIRTFHIAVNDEIEKKLPYVSVPTLVVRGANDPIVPESWADQAAALLPNGARATVPGIGHTLNYSAPLESARLVRLFDNGANTHDQHGGTI